MTSPMTSHHRASHHRGLSNNGNTCYLNSAIQALCHTQPLRTYFTTGPWEKHRHDDRKGHAMTGEFAELMGKLWASKDEGADYVNPMGFVRSFIRHAQEVGSDEIRFGAQADAAEAIQIILDGIHTQQAREVRMAIIGDTSTPERAAMAKALNSWSQFFRKEYSLIMETFYGQSQTRISCKKCKASTVNYEPWGMLKLPIPGAEKAGSPAPTFQECLRANFATETLDDYTCDTCKTRGVAEISHHLSNIPKYMIVTLKRFTNTGSKVRARIPYNPDLIDLSEWAAWHTPAESRFRVYATIEHMGSSRGGHYLMRARSDDKWLVYDDGSCYPSPNGGEAGPDTYVLFLERIDK